MSAIQINLSADLQRLQGQGYDLQIVHGVAKHLLVHGVPYVNVRCEVARGTLVTPLELDANNATVNPLGNHQTWFIGDQPCHKDGRPLVEIIVEAGERNLGDEVVVNYGFSSKPRNGIPYADYFAKMTRYIEIISNPARALDPTVNARERTAIAEDVISDVFHYADTATTRCKIGAAAGRLKLSGIAIVGLGGTGSYILDLVAKTHVTEIHLYDDDIFDVHNAFRAPGAPSREDLTKYSKVTYFAEIYSRMRKGIVPHEEKITAENIATLAGFNFVFVCVDKPAARKVILEGLQSSGVPFIDVGMDVRALRDGTLVGLLRTTLGTQEKTDHIAMRVSFADGNADDVYDAAIQVADLNSLNATLAVIKWKKHFGFYGDDQHEHHSIYTISTHALTKDAKL